MSKQFRSPQEKKDLSYKKDHREAGEYPQALRKNWPKKKAYTNRSYRHRVDQLLHDVALGVDDDDLQNLPADAIPVHRPQIRKWGPTTLRSAIKGSLRNRVRARLGSFSRTPYNSETHKETFTTFLNMEIRSRTAFSRELAFFVDTLLNNQKTFSKSVPGRYHVLLNPKSANETRNYRVNNSTQTWLRAYLKDVPDMEATLRTWIKDITTTKEILL